MSGIMSMLLGAVSSAAAAVDEFFNRVTLLLPGNGTNGAQNNTFLDSSTNNFTITRNGNATQGTFSPFSQTGWSNFFGGNGNYAVSNAAVFTSSTSTFTIEGWIYPTAAAVSGSNIPSVIGDMQPTSTAAYWTFGILASGALSFYWYDGASKSATSNGTVSLNTWTHIAVSVNANAITLYINGVQQTLTGTTTLTNRTGSNSSVAFAQFSNTGSVFTGYLSNISVLSGTAKYSTSFTPTTTPLATDTTNQVLLFASGNRFADFNTATTAKTFTITGTPSVQAFSPFAPTAAYSAATVGGSGYFDGTGDYLSSSGTINWSTYTNLTVEAWVYISSLTGSTTTVQSICGTSQGAADGYTFMYIYNDGKIAIGINGTNEIKSASVVISAGSWNHVAFIKSGSTTTIYVNGASVATNTTAVWSNNTRAIWIGNGSDGRVINGYISNLRITINQALASGAFTPPIAPVTTSSVGWSGANAASSYTGTTFLLLSGTNAGITDATAKNDLETVGNAQISTTQSKFGGSSMYFDGTGDYLIPNAGTTDLYAFGSGDFTVEMWIYQTGSGTFALYDTRPNNTNGAYLNISSTSGQLEVYVSSSSILLAGTISLNTWTHIAVSRSGTNLRGFINGAQVGSTVTNSTVFLGSAQRPVIGASGFNVTQFNFNGYIDDLRVTRGHARYTSNFTAPTAAFPLQ